MIPSIKHPQRLLLSIFLCFFLIQCSDSSKPEIAVPAEQGEQTGKTAPGRILDEIPPHIQEVENLTIFPGDSAPLYSIELIPEQTFGETGEPYFVKISGSVVDDQERVIIWSVDSNYEQILYVYNADGSYHDQLGRRGRGPGEYETMVGLQAKAGKVFVLDYSSQRLNEYSTEDYSFHRSILIETWKIDENRIWVAVPVGTDSDTYEWWILQESGELLAKLKLPRDQPIYDIKDGHLYSKGTNEETGDEFVVKYRIELYKGN
ncbi:6-bladed beta-propeller [Gracilimonas halophila]|uniref:6-bladed beta-propeller n=1 Tax=Gracilimonas halophila TaxID=1834464 RepID=A0ABW5JL68_9BACT